MKKLLGLVAAVASIASLTACNTEQTGPANLKQGEDGRYVVATITSSNGTDKPVEFYADDLYERFLSTSAGQQKIYDRIRREIIIEGFKSNDNFGPDSYKVILEKKNTKKDSLVQEYKDKYKDTYQDELDKLVAQNGAKDLDDYVINYILIDEVISLLDAKYKDDYTKPTGWDKDKPTWELTKMQEKELEDYLNLYNPLDISHILVKTGGSIANPEITEEQGKNLAKVCEALQTGTSTFAQIARTYSEDTGSGAKGGHLGLMDINTSFVNEFKHNTYEYVNGRITTQWGAVGKSVSTITYQNANFVKASSWASQVTNQGYASDMGCQNLGDTNLTNADERNAIFYGLFGDLRIGKEYTRKAANGNDPKEAYMITRSEHGIHFIKVNNTTDWANNLTAKNNTKNIIAKIKEEMADKDKVKESNYTYSATDLLKSYRDKYAQDYYWNLFVNGKVGRIDMTGKTEFNHSSNKVEVKGTDIKIDGTDVNTFFNNQYNKSRETTFDQEKNSYLKAVISWSDILNSDGWIYGYNKKTSTNRYTNPYNTFSNITRLHTDATKYMADKY